jgi:HK97 family phage major capsid protein
MSDPIEQKHLDNAVKVIEGKLTEALKKYEGQVNEHGKAAESIRSDVKKLADDYKATIEASEEMQSRMKEVEQKIADGLKTTTSDAMETWGKKFVDSDAYAQFKTGVNGKARIEVKNTILGESGSPQDPDGVLAQAQRLPGIVPGAFRSLNVLDFVPVGATNSNAIEYVRDSSWTNDAAETAENGTKPESDLEFELINDPVRTIAHFIKASKQVLDDAPALSSYIDRRMRHGIQHRLQSQVLKGNGTSPNISGVSASGRHTAFTPVTGDNAFDAINKAKYLVIGADYQPNFVFLNPADWGAMERLKAGSSDDRYIAGEGGALAYLNNGLTPMIWGLPVIASNDVASGKFYVGDSNAIQLFMRSAAVVEMFEQDDTNVQKNLLTIRAEIRAALAVFTPAAIRYGSLTV